MNFTAVGQQNFEKVEALLDSYELVKAQRILEENYKKSELGQLYLGDINSHFKKWDKAIAYYEDLVNLKPNSALYNFKLGGALGMKAMEISKFQAAFLIPDIKEHLEKAVTIDPGHIESRRALAQLYLELPSVLGGGLDKSLVHAKKLEELSKLDYRIAMAFVFSYKEKDDVSGKIIKQAIKESKESPQLIIRNYLYFELAQEAVRFQVATSEVDDLMQKFVKGFNYLDLKTPQKLILS